MSSLDQASRTLLVPVPPPDLFDTSHYAARFWRKIVRSLQLGPRYFLWDLPRYLHKRQQLHLPVWESGVLINPLRELRPRLESKFPIPPGYTAALTRLADVGVRFTMPEHRLLGLVGAWWATRDVAGDVIECGSYRGATALLLAWLARVNGLKRRTLMLDTFQGTPAASAFDFSATDGQFVPPDDQLTVLRRQLDALDLQDQVEIHQGLFADTFARWADRALRFSFVHIDANIYQGTLEAGAFTIPRTAPGGVVVFDDYNGVCFLGARLAIDQVLAGRLPVWPLAGSSAYVRLPPQE